MKTLLSPSLLGLLALACGSPAVEDEPASTPAASEELAVPEMPEVLEPATCGSIQQLHELGGVYLAGQPSAEDLQLAREAGIRTVIDLRRADEARGYDEAAAVEAAGLEYVLLPWNGPAELTDEVFDRARELLKTAERPILLHCGSANRVGAVWVPYRVLDAGIGLEAALAEARTIGLKTPEYEAKARDYVARHAGG